MRLILVVSLAAVAGLAASPQSPNGIRSARLTMVRESATDLVVAVSNGRAAPLEHVGIQYKTSQGSGSAFWYRTGEPSPPIAPGRTAGLRLEDVEGQFDTSSPPEIVLLEFADGYYEGTAAELQGFFEERARHADDLRYWLAVIAKMPAGVATADATIYVSRAADAQKTQAAARPSPTASALLGLSTGKGPSGSMAELLSKKAQQLEGDLLRATRHSDRFAQVGTSAPVVPERSARVEARTSPGIRLIPVLENFRDVPLQAWGVVFKESGTPTTGGGADTCSERSETSSAGAIGPRETRRLTGVRRTTSQDVPGLTAELVYVVYRDGHAEGDGDEIRKLLAQRKSRGLDCSRYH